MLLANVIVVNISRKTECAGVWCGWGSGMFWFLVGKREGTNHLKVLGMDEMIILNGSTRNGSSFDWDDLSLVGDLCQDLVKTIVNY